MRVICVAHLNNVDAQGSFPVPSIGEECIVTGEGYNPKLSTERLYQLAGYPDNIGYAATGFAILPDTDADEIEAAGQEAIVPNPIIESTPPPPITEVAVAAYHQVYELTGCEQRATAAYFEVLNIGQ